MKTEKNNKKNFREKSAGKQWAGKSETKKYADKKKTEFKKNVTKKTEQKKSEQKKEERKKSAGKSLCPVHGRCGGCQLLDIPYEEQLKQKQIQVTKLLKPYCPTEKIIGMEDPFHYRNKVHAVFGHKKDGTVISGIYQEGTHFIVPVDDCLIEDQKADAIIRDIRGLLKSFKIKTYNEDTGYGLFRHVLIRTGYHSGQIMVVLVLGSPILPSKNNFVKALRKLHPEITTIVLNVNGQKTSMILGEKETVLYGKGYIEDELCGKTFRISSKSFYQVNPVQTEKLYGKAIELAGLTGKERVIDAYCGIGTIGLIASDKAKEVISVELNQDAVRDAIVNAKRNGIKNVRFYHNDAGVFMRQMAEAGEHADVVFMDPPRSGSDEKFLSSVLTLKPEKIVYVSCEPTTLARDLKYLTKHGYKAVRAVPFDMFPATEHVETVCLLSKLHEAKHHVNVRLDMDEMDLTAAESKATYEEIKKYVAEHNDGMKVSNLYIAQIKQKHGIIERENYNKPKSEKGGQPECPKEKEIAIEEALKYFQMIPSES
ncbi:MAG: 23S rRNA (uracil(1939)-C(5))-methyltransferase RlmD [Eubacteriales bacterium]|nr:23S rRNA (uracil(1939)-C(5))-methyltransferase RlmD [Eubacteriales bacterium]